MAFREDRGGTLWIGFYGGGLVAFRNGRFSTPAGDWTTYGHVKDLFLDSMGRLWVSTAKAGIRRLAAPVTDPARVTVYTMDHGLGSNDIQACIEDAEGRMYVATPLGVDRLDPYTGRVRHDTTTEGLAGNLVMVAHRDRLGRLWFGTLNGLSRLTPQLDTFTSPAPPVRAKPTH